MDSILDGTKLKSLIATKSVEEWQGEALIGLIDQALEDPNLFLFGEIIALPGFSQLPSDVVRTVELFAYGTLQDHDPSRDAPLSAARHQKLRKLSVISLISASPNDIVTYEQIAGAVLLPTGRELEDLLIDCIYDGIIVGKLDPERQVLRVKSAIPRDVNPAKDIALLIERLTSWSSEAKSIQDLIRSTSTTLNNSSSTSSISSTSS